ncbi:MAG: thymidylate synthase family protein [Candidatus Latescibacterota bacterium]
MSSTPLDSSSRRDTFARLFPDAGERIRKTLELAETKVQAGAIGIITPAGNGDIPILFARGRCLPEAWENSLVALFAYGGLLETQYDKPDDPPSIDASMVTVIGEPLAEPMIHRSFPGGLEDLEEYRQEVVDGIKNHWVRNPDDPEDNRWEYTYNERMFAYRVPGLEAPIDQFEGMAQALAGSPITRRAQMISWQPWMDLGAYDPACWQSLWGRIVRGSDGAAHLNLNMRFRSRDAYKAAFMNDFAFIDLARRLARRVSELRGEPVKLGRFADQSDSYHIYGSYFREFADGFLKLLFDRADFEDRTWTTEFAEPFFEEARPVIRKKIAEQDAKYGGSAS